MSGSKGIQRREFMKGMAALAGASLLAGCTQPGAAPAPAEQAAGGMTMKYADAACVHHHMTGGFSGPGPDDGLIKQIQEDALRKEYGLNLSLEFESAPWSDIDTLITTRLETQGCDSVERGGDSALNWLAQEGLMQDIEEPLQQYGHNLEKVLPKAAFDYFVKDWPRRAIANFYTTPVDVEYIHIRRDWLDQVDRDIPQTIEDLEECLRLFKEKNLGGDVTIPVSPELGGWVIPSYALTGPFAPEPDEQRAMMDKGEDFEYEHGCAMRERRLELLQKWHKDGLLNPEWPTFKSEDNDSAVDKGIVGCVLGGWWPLMTGSSASKRRSTPSRTGCRFTPPSASRMCPIRVAS